MDLRVHYPFLGVEMTELLHWWCRVAPKAKWLIFWAALYSIAWIALLIVGKTDEYLTPVQMVWVFISSIPLWNKRLADWLGMRPKLSQWIANKLK